MASYICCCPPQQLRSILTFDVSNPGLCKGKSNREIGQILGCRIGTVKKHLYRAYAKLGVENRLQVTNLLLLKNAIESGSISDILRSAATRAVAFAASVALALAEAMSDWDLTFDFL